MQEIMSRRMERSVDLEQEMDAMEQPAAPARPPQRAAASGKEVTAGV
jgi:hypothetical protein